MVIYGIVGRPKLRLGAGKSTLETWFAFVYNQKFGQTIRANYHIKKDGAIFLNNPREVLDVYNSIIVIDDIYRWLGFNNANAKKFGKLMMGELRHHNNNLVWGSSRLKDYVHPTIRQHTDYMIFPHYNKKQQTLTIDYILDAEGEVINGVIPRFFPTKLLKYLWSKYNHREDIQVCPGYF